MRDSYVPHDLTLAPEPPSTEHAAPLRLPLRPRTRPEKWDHARTAALADKDNWRKWDVFFRAVEDAWAAAGSKDAAKAAHDATRAAYAAFLLRFPFSAAHWRQFLILEYKMGTVADSIACLRQAVAAYPQSVLLWVEYLTALTTVETDVPGKSSTDIVAESVLDAPPADAQSATKHDKVRAEFVRAAECVGMDFNSDPFWDKYIAFEKAAAPDGVSTRLLNLYLCLIRIPLYQYAQYYNQFTEISKSFGAADIISETEYAKYLEPFGKSLPAELSVVEQHLLIESYSYDIFTQTQAHVTMKWPFEAALTLQEFLVTEKAAIEAQTKEWIAYLDAEISTLLALASGPQKDRQYLLVLSLFERALVPNCENAGIWLKYLNFVSEYSLEPSLERREDICKRAIYKFVPVCETQIRDTYVQILLKERSFDDANAFLFDCLRMYSGITGPRLYVKEAYVHSLIQTLEMWAQQVSRETVVPALEGLVLEYFTRVDRYKKDTSTKSTKDEKMDAPKDTILNSSHTVAVSRFLNDDGICVVAVHLMRLLLKDPEDTARIRKFYNTYHTEPAFSRSVQFWNFFVDFEGHLNKNLTNLRSVVQFVKTATALPKMAIDAFLDIYYEITCANLAQAMILLGKENYLDILLNIRMEKSDDLHVNKPSRTRLAKNNYLIPEQKPGQTREDALMKLRAKHIAHPGVFVEAVPEMTNRLMVGPWVSLLDDNLEPPRLPTFKNLDKATAPISYPDE